MVERDGERLVVGRGPARGGARRGTASARGRSSAGPSSSASATSLPYPNVEGAHRVVAGDFVSMDDGTGIVHLAPAFGPEDLAVGRAQGWPVLQAGRRRRTVHRPRARVRARPVRQGRRSEDRRGPARAGVLLRSETYEHSYPFCWRCQTPLLYYARTSWYVRTTEVKERLLEVNERRRLVPRAHQARPVRELAREQRRLGAVARTVLGHAPADLALRRRSPDARSARSPSSASSPVATFADVDPHRPAIDEVTIACPTAASEATTRPRGDRHLVRLRRDAVRAVGLPPRPRPRRSRSSSAHFPADFISEAIDQTRGWFYTLMAEGVLHFDSTAYRNVVCLGHIVAADGRKMSKSLGNIFDPWEALDRQGADALRWFMIDERLAVGIAAHRPRGARRGPAPVPADPVERATAFFVTYANADGFDPESAPASASRGAAPARPMDPLAARADGAERPATASRPTTPPARDARIERFVDDLSNWYVRRSRRRFWNPGGEAGDDCGAAFHTLHECLVTVATLLAPFTPFVAEACGGTSPPAAAGDPTRCTSPTTRPPTTARDRRRPRRGDGHRARDRRARHGRSASETKTKVRQPLSEAVVHVAGDHASARTAARRRGRGAQREARSCSPESAETFGRWHAKPDFKVLGPTLGAAREGGRRARSRDDDGTDRRRARARRVP